MEFVWPIDSLAIIAPIVFIVLIVIFPLIGLAAGWKRAAFWGIGNFLFFTIGIIIWKTLADQIVAPLTGFVTDLIHSIPQCQSVTVTPELVKSVLAPFWFLFVMAVGELLLLINYYAWYKRVVGLKKVKIVNKKTGKVTKQYVKVNKKAGTVGYKIGNRLGGLLLLGALTVPSTITFTQMIYYTTTSSSTRSVMSDKTDPDNPKLCLSESLYLGLEKYNDVMGWFSYYDTGTKSTGSTYDSIFSAIHLITKKIVTPEGDATSIMDEISVIVGEDIGGMTTALSEVFTGGADAPKIEEVLPEAFNDIAKDWNNLVGQAQEDIEALFASDVVVEQVNAVLQPMIQDIQTQWGSEEGKFEVNEDVYEGFFERDEETGKSQFDQVMEDYANGELFGQDVEQFQQISIPQDTFNMMTDLFNGLVDSSGLTGSEEEIAQKQAQIEKGFEDILKLLFNPK